MKCHVKITEKSWNRTRCAIEINLIAIKNSCKVFLKPETNCNYSSSRGILLQIWQTEILFTSLVIYLPVWPKLYVWSVHTVSTFCRICCALKMKVNSTFSIEHCDRWSHCFKGSWPHDERCQLLLLPIHSLNINICELHCIVLTDTWVTCLEFICSLAAHDWQVGLWESMDALIHQQDKLERYLLWGTKQRCDVVVSTGLEDESCRCIHDCLKRI